MIKLYAFFGDRNGISPFKLGSEDAWRALVLRFPGLRHYRQFERAPKQLENLALAPYAASAEVWLDDAGDPAQILSALDSAAASLREVFAGNPALLVQSEEHNISGEPWQDSGFKATFFFNRKSTMDLDAFHTYWLNHHGPIAARTQGAERYVQSHISEPGRLYDGITELFWPDHPTAVASMGSEQMTVEQSRDAQNFVDPDSLVVFMGQESG